MTSVLAPVTNVVGKVVRRCQRCLFKGAPPEPCEEVMNLLKASKVTPGHLLRIYDCFHYLRGQEEAQKDEVVQDVIEIEVDSVKRLVVDRRRWVIRILATLLDLADCEEVVSWDEFLWIFIRFCSLSRVELSQVLFLIIQRERKSPKLHYVSAKDLHTWFSRYQECPERAFDTQGIDFDKLPLTRYYAGEFVELVQRFTQLLNPILYLQRVLQDHIPGHDFWDGKDATEQAYCRKISHDFFILEPPRVHLRGVPHFLETCDFLLPDALGEACINRQQWDIRTSGARGGRGLRPVSVFGEQPPPEEIRNIIQRKEEKVLLEKQRDEAIEAARKAAEKGAPEAPALATAAKALVKAAPFTAPPPNQDTGLRGTAGTTGTVGGPPGQPSTTPSNSKVAWQDNQGKKSEGGWKEPVNPAAPQAAAQPLRPRTGETPAPQPQLPRPNFVAWSIKAATTDESNDPPAPELPPQWMEYGTIAPAPQLHKRPGMRPTARTFGRMQRQDEDGEEEGERTFVPTGPLYRQTVRFSGEE